MKQILIYYAIAVVFTLFGYVLCALFRTGSKEDKYHEGYIDGYKLGKKDGYAKAYSEFPWMGETANWEE